MRFPVRTLLVALSIAAAAPFARGADEAPAPNPSLGQGKVVTLDEFYNHQVQKGKPYHYIWEDTAPSGYSKWGKVWTDNGATIAPLTHAPTADDLAKTSIYIISNPSIPANAADGQPNYIEEPAISTIETWVKNGGVLVLMANDPGRCEFTHFNNLASRFGITFDGNMRNTAPKATDRPHATFLRERDKFPDHPLFKGLDATYMKEISTIAVKPPAESLFVVDKDPKESVKTDDGAGPDKDVIMATAKVGKGFVFAVGDPWVYNEYFNEPKDWAKVVPGVHWQNDQAAANLTQWLLPIANPPEQK
jgi:unsaturated rhamnogalacturonyl hydrolase